MEYQQRCKKKENFEEINGEAALKKIARLHLGSWNYKSQDAKKFRHYGPMAQDFYAAFGKDNYGSIGNDTTINQADFNGINMIAIEALKKRTEKIEQLEMKNDALAAENKKVELQLTLLQKKLQDQEEVLTGQINELKQLVHAEAARMPVTIIK